jgi:hypothetical protein
VVFAALFITGVVRVEVTRNNIDRMRPECQNDKLMKKAVVLYYKSRSSPFINDILPIPPNTFVTSHGLLMGFSHAVQANSCHGVALYNERVDNGRYESGLRWTQKLLLSRRK